MSKKAKKDIHELINAAENVIKEARKVLDYLQIEVNKVKKENMPTDKIKKEKKEKRAYGYKQHDFPPVNSSADYVSPYRRKD